MKTDDTKLIRRCHDALKLAINEIEYWHVVSTVPGTLSPLMKELDELLSSQRDSRENEIIKEIYTAYPRHRDIEAARKAIRRALRDPEIPGPASGRAAFLLNATKMFAEHVQKRGTERDYIPYPATWFNRKSYLNSVSYRERYKDPNEHLCLSSLRG